ncbi:hypothetical protein JRX38_06000 [Gluconobacter cerinus]|uniref:hypothetical protein n=1 Tax=Gluconobacter cerinus TaxID=38307 RepID=UPI00193ED8C2|nr:hypothetical protein [Gluconobacter cerinus]MBM3097574.1 hypothetical protein [Gluconobacter cerinus]
MDSRTIDVIENGERVGWYRVEKGIITVTNAKTYQSKSARESNGGANEGLARIILSELGAW